MKTTIASEKRGSCTFPVVLLCLFAVCTASSDSVGALAGASLSTRLLAAYGATATSSVVLFVAWIALSLLALFLKRQGRLDRVEISFLLISAFFAFTAVFGAAAESNGAPLSILTTKLSFTVAVFAFCGWWFIGYIAIAGIDWLFNKGPIRRKSSCSVATRNGADRCSKSPLRLLPCRLGSLFDGHPLIATVLFLGLLWLPLLIAFYPGLFAPGDTLNQIFQFFGYEEATSRSVALVDDAVKLNAHHPVAHTLLMGTCVSIGLAVAGSCNVGYFIYTLLQYLCVIFSLGYGMASLYEGGVSRRARLALLLFFGLMPWFSEFALCGTKDTLFACALLVLCISLLRLCGLLGGMRKKDWVLLALGLGGFCFLKKGYVVGAVILLLLLLLLGNAKRKRDSAVRLDARAVHRAAAVFSCVIAASLVFSNVICPLMKVTPGSLREALSVPTQQVARCVHFFGDELSDEQREAIGAAFSYEAMQDKYNPILSDPVKNTFNKYATQEEIAAFMGAWAEILVEHPKTCIEATMMNCYGWFYPQIINHDYGLASSKKTTWVPDGADYLAFSNNSDSVSVAIGDVFSAYMKAWMNFPTASVLTQVSTYIWTLLVLLVLMRRRLSWFIVLFPLLFILLVNLIGPVVGVRYVFPIVFTLPFLLLLAHTSSHRQM